MHLAWSIDIRNTDEVNYAPRREHYMLCLLYTSDAADERSSVDLGGRRIIKKKKTRYREDRTVSRITYVDETVQPHLVYETDDEEE